MEDVKSGSDQVLFCLQQIKYDALRATSWHFRIIFLAFKSFDLTNCSNNFVDPVHPEEEISRRIRLKCARGLRRELWRSLYLVFLQWRDFSRFVSKGHVSSIIVVLFFSWMTISGLARYLSASGSCGLLLVNKRLGQWYPSMSEYNLKP